MYKINQLTKGEIFKMKKEFKVKALTEKVETLEVNGQWSTSCLNDCAPKPMWSGASSGANPILTNCILIYLPSAYKSLGN
jgi:hypothetical protein